MKKVSRSVLKLLTMVGKVSSSMSAAAAGPVNKGCDRVCSEVGTFGASFSTMYSDSARMIPVSSLLYMRDKASAKTLVSVMSWGRTEGVPRFYIFGEDSASAYVLHHQTSTVLEFQVRDRRGFGGLDGESEGQSMLISD